MKMLSKVLLTVLGIACFLAAAFILLLAYVSFTSPEIGAGFGSFLLAITAVLSVIGFFILKKVAAGKQDNISSKDYADYGKAFAAGLQKGLHEAVGDPVKEEPAASPAPAEEEPAVVPELVEESPEAVEETVEEAVEEEPAAAGPVASVPEDNSKKTVFPVAGLFAHETEIVDNLLFENSDYDMSKKEIIECYMCDEYLYKYEPFYGHADLIPEPDNPYDPNAIKVIVDDIHIGYVPAKRTKSIKKILESGNVIEIGCEIYGGAYKFLPDEESDLVRGKTDLKARICIEYK